MSGNALRVWQISQHAGGKVLEEQGRIELVHGDFTRSDPALQVTTAILPGPAIQHLLTLEMHQRQRWIL
ncbi:hypothetical protein [Thermogemmatispora tikiterensis]|nr:hypothetical protein [Thermogemmatispora tikiterensis]